MAMTPGDGLICVVGARRSGTHWIQRILSRHPSVVAVPTETYLFSQAIAPLFERFQHASTASPMLGQTYIEHDVLLHHARALCNAALQSYLHAGLEMAPRVLERTPEHVHHVELIATLYPRARFVHIIRDGRRVVRSLVDQRWGPRDASAAAREWANAVRAGRRQGATVPHYVEVHHAALRADPHEQVRRILQALELEDTEDIVERAVEEARVVANTHARDPRPPLSRRQLRAVQRVAGDLLDELDAEARGASASSGTLDRPARTPPPPDGHWVSGNIHTTLVGVNRTIEVLRGIRSAHDLMGLLAPEAELRFVDGGRDRHWRGRDAVAGFLQDVHTSGALRGTSQWSTQHASELMHVVFQHGPGPSKQDAVVVIQFRRTGITELGVYTFPLGSQRPAPPGGEAQLEPLAADGGEDTDDRPGS